MVAINAFFVAAEFAIVRARRGELEKLAKDGSASAELSVRQLQDISGYAAAAQLGITLTSIGIGFLGEPAIASLLEPIFGGLSHGLAVFIAVVIAYMIVTSVHITLGEQVPKMWAIVRAERAARAVARPLEGFRIALRPFIGALNWVSNGILRLIGIHIDDELARVGSSEDLKRVIAESLAGGGLDEGEAGMLSGVFHLHEQEARQVMTPIPAVVTMDISENVETGLRRCISSGHTRLIVTEADDKDRVRGFVHLNSLARQLMNEGPEAKVDALVREAQIIPETKPLDDLLAELQHQRTSLAVVVDEYGRTAGIVTVEDIVEEVVGEIDDETDPTGGAVRRLANGDWFVRGHVAVTDLHDYGLELPVDTDAYNSVGGYVFAALGRLPKRGDVVSDENYTIRVESVRENRIEAVRIRQRV